MEKKYFLSIMNDTNNLPRIVVKRAHDVEWRRPVVDVTPSRRIDVSATLTQRQVAAVYSY